MTAQRRPGLSRRLGVALAAAGVLTLAGCTSAPAPSASTEAGSSDGVAVDAKAGIVVDPVDYDGKTAVTATFSEAVTGRQVNLQRKDGGDWKDVAKAAENEQGLASFLVEAGKGDFRAVAVKTDASQASATPSTSADAQWKQAMASDFSENALAAPWNYSISGSYAAGGRQCSAPFPSNVEFSDDKVTLSMTKETEADHIAAAKAAGCKKGEYYRNGMLTTEGQFSVREGVLAARVKFGEEQGMHGSVFLLSSKMQEIDMIESYGYGWGLTSVIHVDGKRYPTANPDTYVAKDLVKDRKWWDEYHTYSVQWDGDDVVFRIDGVESRRLHQANLDDEYFVFVSLLSSDWELKRLDDPVRNAEGVKPTKLPGSMAVDWVKVWTPAK